MTDPADGSRQRKRTSARPCGLSFGRVIGHAKPSKDFAVDPTLRAGLKDEGRPIGVFMFVGPTGVGKTLLAKELSKWLFDENKGLIRIDMSEYSENTTSHG